MNLKFLPDDKADAFAIQSFALGKATEDQMKRAFTCIVRELCGTYEMTFDPENDRVSNFNEGKRHVGRALVNLVNANVTLLYQAAERQPALKTPTQVHRKRKPNG